MDTSVADALRNIKPDDDQRLGHLAEAIRAEGLKKTGEAVSLMHARDRAMADKAFGVVLDIGPIALNPILDSLNPDQPQQCVLELRHALDLAQRDRARLASVLAKLLDDKQDVPLPAQAPNVEEKIKPRRLCDEAYLMLRKLLSPEESGDDHLMNERLFLDLKEEQRDREIARLKKSKSFTPLLEYFPGE